MNISNHGDNLYVVIERYTPVEGKLEEVIVTTTEIGKILHGFPGLLQIQILEPSSKGDVVSTATWESEIAFKNFMKSQVVKDLMKSDIVESMRVLTENSSFDTFKLVDGWHPKID